MRKQLWIQPQRKSLQIQAYLLPDTLMRKDFELIVEWRKNVADERNICEYSICTGIFFEWSAKKEQEMQPFLWLK